MSTEHKKTIDVIKQKRQVPDQARQRRKVYADIRKQLMNALAEEGKSIPELAAETGLPIDQVTYYLMTLRKYGDVVTGELDDDDEYYSYKLKKK